jgi:hypothetical protein
LIVSDDFSSGKKEHLIISQDNRQRIILLDTEYQPVAADHAPLLQRNEAFVAAPNPVFVFDADLLIAALIQHFVVSITCWAEAIK